MASLEYTAQSPYNVTTAPVQPAMPQVANNDFLQTIPFGLRSNTWRTQDAEMAKSLAKNGVDAISIYKQTGTWLSSDGKWRQEVAKGGQFPQGAGKAGVYKLPADYNVKGPVDSIAEAAKAQYAKGALSGLLNNPKQSIGDAVKDVKNLFNPEYMRNIQGMSNEEVTNLALDANPVMGAITVAHGSPHIFDRFDLSKARTGHGAQAYSSGAYLSESTDVAKGFQPRSDKLENAIGKLSEKSYNTNNYIAADIYDNFLLHKTPDEIAQSIKESGYSGKDLITANQALQQGTKLYKKHSKGGLYKVDLPDEYLPNILDWDKPLHEQPKPVYDALMKAGNVSDNFTKQLLAGGKGEDIYTALFNAHQLGKIPGEGTSGIASEKAASDFLNNLGIKGVKYFDRSSPGSGSGVNNYVVYDPNILKILERNSQPVK